MCKRKTISYNKITDHYKHVDTKHCTNRNREKKNMSYIDTTIQTNTQTVDEQLNRFQQSRYGMKTPDASAVKSMTDKSTSDSGFNAAAVLPGPMSGQHLNEDLQASIIVDEINGKRRGIPHEQWMRWQDEAAAKDSFYASNPRGMNIVIPRIMTGDGMDPFRANVVILADEEDCSRIAKNHVKKQPNFTSVFFDSLIATQDNDSWKKQRNQFNEVFLPKKSLSRIFPTSLERAVTCADRLQKLSDNQGEYGVQMHEFYLHEAQAQLQMALFGMDAEYMESTNIPIRKVFSGDYEENPSKGADVVKEFLAKVGENPAFATASNEKVLTGQKDVFGPLSKSVANAANNLDMNLKDQFGNMMLILFAGHDTTGHTMTWLTYELAKNPTYQKRLQDEVDTFFKMLNGRDMTYEDLDHLPFLTRCVMETLRLWTAVPNGTFRELQYDDYVKGPGGEMVKLEKGTYVQIQNWTRHRNPNLWGDDVNEFNPDRNFRDDEIWGGETFKGYNPSSERFSPFTFAPRDCLGKNFAQMEMRTILANVFHRFKFDLSEPYKNFDTIKQRTNGLPLENVQGTMGPRDLTPKGIETAEHRYVIGKRPNQAMYLKVTPRAQKSSL